MHRVTARTATSNPEDCSNLMRTSIGHDPSNVLRTRGVLLPKEDTDVHGGQLCTGLSKHLHDDIIILIRDVDNICAIPMAAPIGNISAGCF